MYGRLVFCTQNLAVSGANQILINLLEGTLFDGVVNVLSPRDGPMRKTFVDCGALVHVCNVLEYLNRLTGVRLVVCNTIMTADVVLHVLEARIPYFWIVHEWWTSDMITSELASRNMSTCFEEVIQSALSLSQNIVFVCEAQRRLYNVAHTSTHVVHVGVPRSFSVESFRKSGPTKFLCMGVVCPRKNQLELVSLFKRFAGSRSDVCLDIVGARYVRDYETQYAHKVTEAIGEDKRIRLHPVTNDPVSWYAKADVLILLSLNEVTPLVICEAMLAELPVITSNIAGIPEMIDDGVHGYLVAPNDHEALIASMHKLHIDPKLRRQLGKAGREHALKKFTVERMIRDYSRISRTISPVTILIDMDGVLVDWDQGFVSEWKGRSEIVREKSYVMQECVPTEFKQEAIYISRSPGFFATLPPMEGAIEAIKALADIPGFNVLICTSPLLSNPTCVQDKFSWVRSHLGPDWVERIVLTRDKTTVRGDILIDDKPEIQGSHHPTWIQAVFDQPYNRHLCPKRFQFRMRKWTNQTEWKNMLLRALKFTGHIIDEADLAIPKLDLPQMHDRYREEYKQWRLGSPRGASERALEKRQSEIEQDLADLMESHYLLNCDDFEEIFVFRKSYREWRKVATI
jgi:5'-nucleotidase